MIGGILDSAAGSISSLDSSSRITLAEWDDQVQRSFHRKHIDEIIATTNQAVANIDTIMTDVMNYKQRIYDLCDKIR